MANRVLLDASGLKVSKPGVDVLTMGALGKDVAFNSDWLASSRILLTGSVNVPNGTGIVTENYGFTLPFVPVILMMGRARAFNSRWYNMQNVTESSSFINHSNGSNKTAAENYFGFATNRPPSVSIYNDRFTFAPVAPYFIDRISYVVLGA
ncbi:hypothetical protein [Pelagibacterium lacus]|uniref:Uncharacterized protein n=1 Tax=Pelagibacterium lacus TaxID=2282655 RepID=A0A369W4Z9_9HYPH|nr:hypothetical protein [Pelagibacterium lacus]RDE08440.1 hypothetical protein DVH29_11255 [Pelagibacterium lacus]